jgi:spore germination protein
LKIRWLNRLKGQSKESSVYIEKSSSESANDPIPRDLQAAGKKLQELFRNCSEIVFRELTSDERMNGVIVYLDGMVDSEGLHTHVVRPLLEEGWPQDKPLTIQEVSDRLSLSQLTITEQMDEAVRGVLAGNAALFVEGWSEALVLGIRGGEHRSVQEPSTETVIRGPREGFTESVMTNLSLIRSKVKSTKLKTIKRTVGEHTLTSVVVAYIEGLADPKMIELVVKRIEGIHIDGILESGYIEEFIEDRPLSPFPQLQNTERPDAAAANLLEGSFLILVDGTPFVLIGPVTFWQMIQSSEDYYERHYIGTLLRWLRYMFLLVALYFPALYVAVTSFHQDMLPTSLILSIAASRETIPFPALIEALIMEIAFEALREAGIRLPKLVGQAVGILGALVIGQAAVNAGIVSAPIVIIVSVTGIASFAIPRFNFSIAIRMLRFPIMIMAGIFGLFGIIVSSVWLTLHLVSLTSFGQPYMSGVAPLHRKELKDIFVRVPWTWMTTRPMTVPSQDQTRQDSKHGIGQSEASDSNRRDSHA